MPHRPKKNSGDLFHQKKNVPHKKPRKWRNVWLNDDIYFEWPKVWAVVMGIKTLLVPKAVIAVGFALVTRPKKWQGISKCACVA